MNIVFWQNIFSPHQSDFISALSENHDITLIVMNDVDNYRRNQHWDSHYSQKIKIVKSPSFYSMYKILKNQHQDSVNVFSGFLAYKGLSWATVIAMSLSLTCIIVSEAVELKSLKGKAKGYFRRLLASYCIKKIQKVFAIGVDGTDYFKFLGFPEHKVRSFGYFVNQRSDIVRQPKESNKTNLLFVGRLIPLKGINELLLACKSKAVDTDSFQLRITGDGILKAEIQKFISQNIELNIELLGNIPRDDVLQEIANADVLILPNTADEGWGVVINEALLAGTPVVCSQFTGANIIVSPNIQGKVVQMPDIDMLVKAIDKSAQLNRVKVRSLAEKQITPKVAADYFIKSINSTSAFAAPWETLE
jgi:glycosyltransferase involved in cell wall biosynthesis